MLIAQLPIDPQTFTLAIQAGCFGLLAYLLIISLPKERKEAGECHEREVKSITDAHERQAAAAITTFQAEMRTERETCEKRHAESIARHEAVMEGIKACRHAVRDTHQSVSMHHALLDQLAVGPRPEEKK